MSIPVTVGGTKRTHMELHAKSPAQMQLDRHSANTQPHSRRLSIRKAGFDLPSLKKCQAELISQLFFADLQQHQAIHGVVSELVLHMLEAEHADATQDVIHGPILDTSAPFCRRACTSSYGSWSLQAGMAMGWRGGGACVICAVCDCARCGHTGHFRFAISTRIAACVHPATRCRSQEQACKAMGTTRAFADMC